MKVAINEDSPVCIIIGAESLEDSFKLGKLSRSLHHMNLPYKEQVGHKKMLISINIENTISDFPNSSNIFGSYFDHNDPR